jgi:hypothetical protein
MYWGNFTILRCFTKRFYLGELRFGIFEVLGGGFTWSCEEGGQYVFHFVQLGDLSVKIGVGGWGVTKNIHEGRGI